MTPFIYAFVAPVHENIPIQVMIMAVAILIVLDFATGMLGAIINKNWKSNKVREGLAHKCAEFGFLIVGDVIDALLFAGVELPFEIPNGCAIGFIALSIILMELSSIMENSIIIDPRLEKIKLFKVLHDAHVIDIELEQDKAKEVENGNASIQPR